MIALWYASRATGLVSLVLLTAVIVLGTVAGARVSSRAWPRFAIAALHRNLSLLALMFVAVHAVAAVIDTYADIRWLDVVLPFVSSYEPFWLGLGAAAFDLLVALIVSSLLRPRISARLWRGMHWLAYACWPVALVHGIGLGEADATSGWGLVLVVACVLAVAGALAYRVGVRHPDTEARRRAPAELRGRT